MTTEQQNQARENIKKLMEEQGLSQPKLSDQIRQVLHLVLCPGFSGGNKTLPSRQQRRLQMPLNSLSMT